MFNFHTEITHSKKNLPSLPASIPAFSLRCVSISVYRWFQTAVVEEVPSKNDWETRQLIWATSFLC